MEDWQGEERRSIPIHILNHIDNRLQEHIVVVDSSLCEIKKSLEENNKSSEERHSILVDKITVYQGEVELLKNAFLITDKGHPDYEGHKMYHHAVKASSEWWDKTRQNVVTKVLEWGTVGILAWVLSQILQGKTTL